jgi:hypothetical protein
MNIKDLRQLGHRPSRHTSALQLRHVIGEA